MTALSEFGQHDAVRLLKRHGDVRAGALGRIVGRFNRQSDPTYVVSFDDEQMCDDVRSDEIIPADDVRASA